MPGWRLFGGSERNDAGDRDESRSAAGSFEDGDHRGLLDAGSRFDVDVDVDDDSVTELALHVSVSEIMEQGGMSSYSEDSGEVFRRKKSGGALLGGTLRGFVASVLTKAYVRSRIKRRVLGDILQRSSAGSRASVQMQVAKHRQHQPVYHSKLLLMVESSLLGIAVFGVYDLLVSLFLWKRYQSRKIDASLDAQNRRTDSDRHQQQPIWIESFSDAPSWVHASAGGLAGMTHSLVWLGWERWVYRSKLLTDRPVFSARTLLHHGLGYASLFGTYSALHHLVECHNSHVEGTLPDASTVRGTFVAGGVHHAVDHYTGIWRNGTSITRNHAPKIRHVLLPFLPMGVSFVAFEHAGAAFDWCLARNVLGMDDFRRALESYRERRSTPGR